MPRDLPIGNGRLLINFDQAYQLRDLYYPYVGKENHTSGHPFRFGVWVDGQLRWMDDHRWERQLRYLPDSGSTDVSLHHPDLRLRLECQDVVDFTEPLYLRRITISNQHETAREVRLFFHHDFHIAESEYGDTAYYEPDRRALIHYKGERWFLINACPALAHPAALASATSLATLGLDADVEDREAPGAPPAASIGMDSWATGAKEIGGAEGTWRDAEDGELGRNSIAQGAVDSTGALHVVVPGAADVTAYYWIACGRDFDGVTRLNQMVRDRGPQHFMDRSTNYWRLWINKEEFDLSELPENLASLFKHSLFVMQTQIDNRGAIVAANDWDITRFNRDTYSYVWPRDGALVAHALDLAGYATTSRKYFEFCARVLTADGYFLHKYNPDGSLGSSWQPWYGDGQKQLPIQEDETGLVIWALWDHFQRFRDVEFIESMYDSLVVPAARFMARYCDRQLNLPLPSYDLWEERRGVLAFTVGAVYGGMVAAANFAGALGDAALRDDLLIRAAELKAGCDHWLWQEQANRFVRMVQPRPDGSVDVDWAVDASVYGLWMFGMYPADDPRIVSTMESVRKELWVKTDVGGVARYQQDYYQHVTQEWGQVPGNPWFICTLWLAEWHIAKASTAEDLAPALELLQWVAKRALPSGVLAEQVHPYTGEPLSVSPLTWSHATFVATVLELLERRRTMDACPTCGAPGYLREQGRTRHMHAD